MSADADAARAALDRYVASDSRSLRRYEAARNAFEAAIRAAALDEARAAVAHEAEDWTDGDGLILAVDLPAIYDAAIDALREDAE